jgi:DNA-binding LacI/PurR family transcriptional regulator
MRRVAVEVGVSQSTVSRVLSGASGAVPIAKATRDRVLRVAADLGYAPNPLARGLRGTSTGFIGVLIMPGVGPFFSAMIPHLSAKAREQGYRILLGYAAGDANEGLDLETIFETRYCDGMLVLGDVRDQPTLLAGLRSAKAPLVEVCAGDRGGDITGVDVDNPLGARLLMQHLWGLGHRRIAFVGGVWRGGTSERQHEFERFMRSKHAEIPAGYIQSVDNSYAGGRIGVQQILGLAERPTAVFAATDGIAVGILRGAADSGLSVPRDMSVVGFDGIALGEFTIPALTTVASPMEELAGAAIRELLRLLSGEPPRSGALARLQPTLVVRSSTAPTGG